VFAPALTGERGITNFSAGNMVVIAPDGKPEIVTVVI
jgi:hypothetical protein